MKVLLVISLFACAAAKGSGPYLPRGWRPDGPSFYLPSEVSKPLGNNIKEIILSESEASGSDFLREYGPPKSLDASKDIVLSQQGLPDVVNDKLFYEVVVESNDVKQSNDLEAAVNEEKVEVNAVVKNVEALAITESLPVTEIVTANDQEEITTTDKTDEEFGYEVDATIAVVVPTEVITIEVTETSANQDSEDNVAEAQQSNVQEELNQSVDQVEETATQNANGSEQNKSDNSEDVTITALQSSEISTSQQANVKFDVISTVEETIETVQEEVEKVEEVVQNIPELIVGLENEIKGKQAETVEEVPAIVKETFGSLEQIPEGFLEYGPPGFTEYGPPENEKISDNIKEDKASLVQSIENNQLRKRRFSPKFRSSKKLRKN